MYVICASRRRALARLVSLLIPLTACSDAAILIPPAPIPDGATLVVGPGAITLTPGLTQQLLAVVERADGQPLTVDTRWTSSDPVIAPITAGGLVTANRVGAAVLEATSGRLVARVGVTIQTAAVTSTALLEHRDVVSTVFWVGEGADRSNGFISNAQSAFDGSWLAHYGGVDAPSPRRGYLPADFTPLENPFYVALPYSDMGDDGRRKQNAPLVIPWAAERPYAGAESMVKNRWLRVTSPQTGRTCYAQWEDAGPGLYDDFQYVFGSVPASNPFVLSGFAAASALDVSPAVRDCLGHTAGVMRLNWQFVADAAVPAGPWTDLITRRQSSP